MAQTFTEYFLIIVIDPQISMRTYLYNTDPHEILKFYANEIKPEILSKYPPIQKTYINIDNIIIDISFPNGFKLEEFSSKLEPEKLFLLLDNYFYSIDPYLVELFIFIRKYQYFLHNIKINKQILCLFDSR